MEKKVPSVAIGKKEVFGFEFSFKETGMPQDAQAWGEGMVFLNSVPVWYFEENNGGMCPVEWSWLDLLAFLAEAWPWILYEEGFPSFLEEQPSNPGDFWAQLNNRWEGLSPEDRGKEENVVKRYVKRHDLALGMKGVFLPQIFVLRQGQGGLIYSDESKIEVDDFRDLMIVLAKVGDYIADYIREHALRYDDKLAKQVLNKWNDRKSRSDNLYEEISSGFSKEELVKISGGADVRSFFNISNRYEQNELLVAARMSKGRISIPELSDLLSVIKEVPLVHTGGGFDDVRIELHNEIDKIAIKESPPWEQGYAIASMLRKQLGIQSKEAFNTEKFLKVWGINIIDKELMTDKIEAVAVWGDRHGPAIIVNKKADRNKHGYGRRATLAHEMCHLFVDKGVSLPVVELFGGAVSTYIEQRAGAFAAEILLPRSMAAHNVKQASSIDEAVDLLSYGYQVSRAVAALQIKNSEGYSSLSLSNEERRRLDRVVHDASR